MLMNKRLNVKKISLPNYLYKKKNKKNSFQCQCTLYNEYARDNEFSQRRSIFENMAISHRCMHFFTMEFVIN